MGSRAYTTKHTPYPRFPPLRLKCTMANERISYSAAVAVPNSSSKPCSAAENGGESFQEPMPPNTWVCSHASCKRLCAGMDSFAKVCSARSKKACFQCCSPIASASWAISVNAWSKRRNNSGSVMCFFLIAANSSKLNNHLCIANHRHNRPACRPNKRLPEKPGCVCNRFFR